MLGLKFKAKDRDEESSGDTEVSRASEQANGRERPDGPPPSSAQAVESGSPGRRKRRNGAQGGKKLGGKTKTEDPDAGSSAQGGTPLGPDTEKVATRSPPKKNGTSRTAPGRSGNGSSRRRSPGAGSPKPTTRTVSEAPVARKHDGNGSTKKHNGNGSTASGFGSARKRSLPVIQDDALPSPAGGGEADLRFRLASLLRVSDNLVSKAVSAYDRLFSLDRSDQSEIYLQMGAEFSVSGRLDEAVRALRKAAHFDPQNATAFTELGIVHVRLRAPVAAIQSFERARELGAASFRLQKYYAEALIMKDRPADAVAELERAVRLAPDSADAWFRLGSALDMADNHDEAIEAFQMCVELDPENIEYQQRLGFAFESAGRRSEAVKCFKRALALEHDIGGAPSMHGAER